MEKDNKHRKINKCIKDVEFNKYKKFPNGQNKKNIDIYKDNEEGMKYQKVVFNSIGGMNSSKREKK